MQLKGMPVFSRILIITGLLAVIVITAILLLIPGKPSYLELDNPPNTVKVWLEHKSDSLTIVHADSYFNGKKLLSTTWKLPYPVYQFQGGDVNGDGNGDILIGVIKPTRFDPVKRKRLFIFKLFEGYIRPMWLGSRVGQPLEDFRLRSVDGKNIIRTIEQEADGSFLVAEYKWRSFGLQFMHYIERRIPITRATELLKNNS